MAAVATCMNMIVMKLCKSEQLHTVELALQCLETSKIVRCIRTSKQMNYDVNVKNHDQQVDWTGVVDKMSPSRTKALPMEALFAISLGHAVGFLAHIIHGSVVGG